MPGFNPKSMFLQAQQEESEGQNISASRKYAKIASYLLRRGKTNEADRLLTRAIELNDAAPRVHLEKALCEAVLGKNDAAVQSLDAFVRIAIRKRKMREYSVLVEAKLAPYPKLRERYFRLFLEQDAGEAGPHLGLARALIAQQAMTRAKAVLVEGLKTGTRRAELIGLLRQALEGLNQMESLFYLQQFEEGKISRPEMVLLLSEGKASGRPESSSSLLGNEDLSNMVRALEQELGIEAQTETAIYSDWLPEFEGQLLNASQKDSALRIDLAIGCYEMGLVNSALNLLASISRKDALYWNAQCLSGSFHLRQNKDLLALPFFQSCLRYAKPGSLLALESCYSLVQIYVRLGDIRRAWELAEELKDRDPHYRESRALRATIEAQIGELKIAG